jgi:hypothetical protein
MAFFELSTLNYLFDVLASVEAREPASEATPPSELPTIRALARDDVDNWDMQPDEFDVRVPQQRRELALEALLDDLLQDPLDVAGAAPIDRLR